MDVPESQMGKVSKLVFFEEADPTDPYTQMTALCGA